MNFPVLKNRYNGNSDTVEIVVASAVVNSSCLDSFGAVAKLEFIRISINFYSLYSCNR